MHNSVLEFVPQTANTEINVSKNSSVKIVFLLTLNGRAVRQVKRLLKILYHREHYYYIHVDVVSNNYKRILLYPPDNLYFMILTVFY